MRLQEAATVQRGIRMKAIIKREFNAYFNSMLGYVFLTIFLMLTGVMFYLVNIYYKTSTMTGFFSVINTWTIMLLPILTMRMFSEDRKMKTDQLLITSPVSISEIILGKYFAAVGAFITAVAITLIYPITLNIFGNLPVAETISCYIGFILLCTSIIAIGAFMSSLTESQIVAAISTYGVLIITVFLGKIAASVANETISRILLWLSPIERFSDFTMGILNLESVIYYLSVSALFLFLTGAVFEKRRFK